MAEENAVDNFLAHYGVKGMKWGVTKSQFQSMNKDQQKAQKTKEIEAARVRGAKGENFKNYSKARGNVKTAKAGLKAAKKEGADAKTIAKHEAGVAKAKSMFKSVKLQNQTDYMNGTSAKNGKELARVILLGELGRAINLSSDQQRLLAKS